MNLRACMLTLITGCLLISCGNDAADQTPGEAVSAAQTESTLFAALPADDTPDEKTFQTLDGRGFDVEFLNGKKVFVNFWATWCAPCIREIPSINRAAEALASEGFDFIFVSDEDVETINDFLTEREFDGNFVKLNGYFANYGIGAVPSSWLLDENGDLVATWAGAYEWDSDVMLSEIRNPPIEE